jgi:hypothetical protein
LGPQHELPHNFTHSPIGINSATNVHSTTTAKQSRTATPPSQPSHTRIETTEVKTDADRGRRDMHHHIERATATQDPTPQCCCTRNWPPGGMLTPSQKQTLACAGTSNPPLSTPLSLVRGDPTRRTAPRFRLVSRIAVTEAQRGAPPSEPNQAAYHHRGSNHSVAFPLAQTAAIELETEEFVYAVFRRCIALGNFSSGENPRHNPLQAKSPLAAGAASAVSGRCPAPHRGVQATPGAAERCKRQKPADE